MWSRRLNIFKLLTDLNSPKVKFNWKYAEQEVFDKIKKW